MSTIGYAPQFAANLLVVAFAGLEARRWLRGRSDVPASAQDNRGTTAVLIGCYGIALLALNGHAASLLPLPQGLEWSGIALGAGAWPAMTRTRESPHLLGPLELVTKRGCSPHAPLHQGPYPPF